MLFDNRWLNEKRIACYPPEVDPLCFSRVFSGLQGMKGVGVFQPSLLLERMIQTGCFFSVKTKGWKGGS